jgi:hypothetical protein
MASGSVGGSAWQTLFGTMKQVRAAWPTRGWSWDGRLQCVSSSFAAELEGKAKAAARLALPNEWTSSTIHRAPTPLRQLAERTGGLRPGQMVLSGTEIGAAVAYGLWWPWGDGMTTSIRIGLEGMDHSQEAFQRLRDAFNVEL